MEQKSYGDRNCSRGAPYNYQKIDKRTGGLRNKRTDGDHLNYSIVEIGQNTEKSPGDLRRYKWKTFG